MLLSTSYEHVVKVLGRLGEWDRILGGAGPEAARTAPAGQRLVGDHSEASVDSCAPCWVLDPRSSWLGVRSDWVWDSTPTTYNPLLFCY